MGHRAQRDNRVTLPLAWTGPLPRPSEGIAVAPPQIGLANANHDASCEPCMQIRHCRADDLDALEWEGELSHDRAIIRDTFARTQRGEMAMLVAEIDDVIVGQVWIDFVRRADAAYVWAVRVRRAWRGRGIASRLLATAEQLSASRGFAILELDVEVANKLARGFYERRGYEVLGRDPNTLMVKLRKLLRR